MTTVGAQYGLPRELSGEMLAFLIEDAEQTLADVDLRDEMPIHPPLNRFDGDEGALLHALGEIAGAHPAAGLELAHLVERVRETGVGSAETLLERKPHLLQILRLALEVFFCRYPTLDSYSDVVDSVDEELEGLVPGTPAELWRARRQWLTGLRRTLS